MNYEEKYKEALDLMKDCVPDENGLVHVYPEEIFPELAESEDERIRKDILAFIRREGQHIDKYKWHKWIAWLEKQEQKKCIDDLTQQEAMDIAVAKCFEQGEQKHAGKVEPKFKVGDWIVQENTGVYKIVEICEFWYEVLDIKDNHYSISFDKEYMCHLWTIQDAKDGDVLVGEYDDCKKPWVGIFKCISENRPQTQFDSYCFIKSSHHEFITPDSTNFYNRCKGHTIRYAKPATKEQREFLFQKMKEAGYEWDSEKKKLKKIEQKPAWSEEDENVLLDIEEAIINYWHGDTQDILLCFLKSLKERHTWKPSEEQMEALKTSFSYWKGTTKEVPHTERLESLYEQLKQL